MKKVTLEKTKIKEGSYSSVIVGRRAFADNLLVYRDGKMIINEELDTLEGKLQPKDMTMVYSANFIKTSPIVSIIKESKDEVLFETETSVYKLTLTERSDE